MAKQKKRVSIADRLGHAVGDIADAVSVAATGSQIGVLEMAAEDELDTRPIRRARTTKVVVKKKTAPTKRRVKKATTKKAAGKKTPAKKKTSAKKVTRKSLRR